MNLACVRTRRAAALGVPEHQDGSVAEHLAQCAACRVYAADLADLGTALGASLPHIRARDTLTDRIVAGLEIRGPAPRRRRWSAGLAWGSVAAAVAGVAWWAARTTGSANHRRVPA